MVVVKYEHSELLSICNLGRADSINVCRQGNRFTLSAFFKGEDIEHVLFVGEKGECEYWLNQIWEAWGSPDRMCVDLT